MATKGGKRVGAGRPKGSTNTYKFSDYVKENDRKTFVEFILSNYMGDMRLAQWMGDHLFSKPKQDVGVDLKSNLVVTFDNSFKSKHD